jgi:hypothetical protein
VLVGAEEIRIFQVLNDEDIRAKEVPCLVIQRWEHPWWYARVMDFPREGISFF